MCLLRLLLHVAAQFPALVFLQAMPCAGPGAGQQHRELSQFAKRTGESPGEQSKCLGLSCFALGKWVSTGSRGRLEIIHLSRTQNCRVDGMVAVYFADS